MKRFRRAAMMATLVLPFAAPASAQLQTGNLYGIVNNGQGEPIAGAYCVIYSSDMDQGTSTNAQGQFALHNLSPGSYQLDCEADGHSTVTYPSVVINVGRNTTMAVTLSSAIEETI